MGEPRTEIAFQLKGLFEKEVTEEVTKGIAHGLYLTYGYAGAIYILAESIIELAQVHNGECEAGK